MSKSSINTSYAKACYALLKDEKQDLQQVLVVLQNVRHLGLEHAEFKQILKNPFVSSVFKIDLLYRLSPEIEKNSTLKKLVCLLAEKKKLYILLELAPQFEKLFNEEQNITEINVISAAPLSEAQLKSLTSTLETSLGGKITLKTSLDKSLIAGLIVQSEQYVLDNSAKSRLGQIQKYLNASNN